MARLAKNASPVPGLSPFSSSPTHLPSRNVLFLTRLFENAEVRDKFLYVSGVYSTAAGPMAPSDAFWDVDVAVSHFHCLYGRISSRGAGVGPNRDVASTLAKLKAYNIEEYTRGANWGPFRNERGGAMDWTSVEASMEVLAHNTSGPE